MCLNVDKDGGNVIFTVKLHVMPNLKYVDMYSHIMLIHLYVRINVEGGGGYSVSLVSGLRAGWYEIRSPAWWTRDFSFHRNAPAGSAARQLPFHCVLWSLLPRGVRRPWLEADISPLYRAEVTNACSYTSSAHFCLLTCTWTTLPLSIWSYVGMIGG